MLNLQSPVEEIMSTNLITLTQTDTLLKVKDVFDKNRIHHIPIVENDSLVGIVSKSDFLFFQRGFSSDQDRYRLYRLKTYTVDQIMTKGVAKLDVKDKIDVALELFKENLFHAIPITRDNDLVGIVTTYDVISTLSSGKGAINKYQKAS